MQLHIKSAHAALERHAALVVAVGPGQQLSSAATAIDQHTQGQLSQALKAAGFEGKPGEVLPLWRLHDFPQDWLLVVGMGASHELQLTTLLKMTQAAIRQLHSLHVAHARLTFAEIEIAGVTAIDQLTHIARSVLESSYRFDLYKTQNKTPASLTQMSFSVDERIPLASGREALAWAQAVAAGTALARDLGNLPGNVCTPRHLAEQAQELAKGQRKLKVKVLGEAQLEKLGAGAFMAVSRGSQQEGQLVTIEYRGGPARQAPIALIGKGITFDTGGISLKPAATMDEMKFDMCGAASVLGVMRTIIAAQLPINVVGVLACAENMPSGGAGRPGDIVTSLSGKTIEILNTDAEGRLVLCDALTYTQKTFKPALLIDIATLTGACVVALGKVASGIFSSDDALAEDLIAAGEASLDRGWRLPLWKDYQELLDSTCADMANIGGPTAGAITAACFLARFTEGQRWAHLDIAGSAWLSGTQKGATGRPVALLSEYLRRQAYA